MQDNELIQKLKSGDGESFRVFFSEFKDRVYNTSLGILQNSNDAEDTVQEVFLEIFRAIENFRGESSLSTWVYRVTVNKSLEHLRKSKRKKRFAFVETIFGEKSESENLPDFNHPGVLLENSERSAVLFKAIDKLKESQKSAFVLSKVEGLSNKEIGNIMNITESSVESLIHRAKENLRKMLENYYKNNI
ncbi:MAG: RNA polymerase sigma factor [Bacteroidetes bacterium]|nr:RNA polymerase sigma factor [Bacteroidota bacterium]